jgi:hypothetical protein
MGMTKLDKLKSALYHVPPDKVAKAKWVVYAAVGISTLLMFGCEGGGDVPKFPRAAGD